MKKLVLSLVVFLGFLTLVLVDVRADYTIPNTNITWTVTNPAPSVWEGNSQYITVGVSPSSYVFVFNNVIPSSQTLEIYLNSTTGGYTVTYLVNLYSTFNYIDFSELFSGRTFYSDTRFKLRLITNGSYTSASYSTYLESNIGLYDYSVFSGVVTVSDEESYAVGYSDGLDMGVISGYDTGFNEGYLDGIDDGYIDGYSEGSDTGYTSGYNDGVLSNVNFWGGVWAFFDGLFTVTLFPGLTIGGLLSISITLPFAYWVLRFFKK